MNSSRETEPTRLNELISYLRLDATSGRSGKQWLRRFRKRKMVIPEEIQEELLSDRFIATNGLRYQIAIIRNTETDLKISLLSILEKLSKRLSFGTVSLEQYCLLCERVGQAELADLKADKIIVMNKPIIRQPRFTPELLGLYQYQDLRKKNRTVLELLASETKDLGKQKYAFAFDASPVYKAVAARSEYEIRPYFPSWE